MEHACLWDPKLETSSWPKLTLQFTTHVHARLATYHLGEWQLTLSWYPPSPAYLPNLVLIYRGRAFDHGKFPPRLARNKRGGAPHPAAGLPAVADLLQRLLKGSLLSLGLRPAEASNSKLNHSVDSYCGWTESVLHQLETMGNHCSFVHEASSEPGAVSISALLRPSCCDGNPAVSII